MELVFQIPWVKYTNPEFLDAGTLMIMVALLPKRTEPPI